MKKNNYLKLVLKQMRSNYQRNRPPLRDQIYIALATIGIVVFILASALLLPEPASAAASLEVYK